MTRFGVTPSLSFGTAFLQADGNAIEVDHSIYMYGVNDRNNKVYLNSTVTPSLSLRSTPEEAITDWLLIYQEIHLTKPTDEPFYFKYKIEDNTIKESYLEFVVTEEMAQSFRIGVQELIH